MRISTNVPALAARRGIMTGDHAGGRSLERLTSGLRINRAADDAAGLSISEGLRSQFAGMQQAVRNTQDGIDLVRTAEGALAETTSLLQRMRDLSVQAANTGARDLTARGAIQLEIDELAHELTRIATTTSFNGTVLLDGSYRGTLQVGAGGGDAITVVIGGSAGGMDAVTLGVGNLDVVGTAADVPTAALPPPSDVRPSDRPPPPPPDPAPTSSGAGTDPPAAVPLASAIPPPAIVSPSVGVLDGAMGAIDQALHRVLSARAGLGALHDRLEHTVARTSVAAENAAAAYSRIRDADMAEEMTAVTRSRVLAQAGTAMLAQATQAPQRALRLLV